MKRWLRDSGRGKPLLVDRPIPGDFPGQMNWGEWFATVRSRLHDEINIMVRDRCRVLRFKHDGGVTVDLRHVIDERGGELHDRIRVTVSDSRRSFSEMHDAGFLGSSDHRIFCSIVRCLDRIGATA